MKKVTAPQLVAMKGRGQKIVVLTAYDYATARIVDRAGADAVLVGDSLGMVIQGHESTLPVKLEHMIYHTQCVARANPRGLLVADLPFGTFQRGPDATLEASLRLVQEAGAEAVKVEGADDRLLCIERVARADIPVWGHLGLTPQSVHAFGGYRVQGKSEVAARRLVDAARKIEAAGASAMVLECIPAPLAAEITETVSIPTIGIGAGVGCDGQVLVFHDVLGLIADFQPKFVKRYVEGANVLGDALARFAEDIRSGRFPTEEHSFAASETRQGNAASNDEEL
jgi:3-methyl-2-oxobutanoate hydroxymethyltransferase